MRTRLSKGVSSDEFTNAPFSQPCRAQVSGWTCSPTPIIGERTGETRCRHDTGKCIGIPCCGLPQHIQMLLAWRSRIRDRRQ
ncbi:hypothetical protein RHA1_ro10294 (plasmid) [Rhodococcus jostii RHA1]|uniref:Uncharacterized protein n=1 Tax=Rhodococcus jostii (strain RHA1) TaxID=101510 RepID=Q0RW51_RHOJR|nr:hypothetical protein RHA1_ro10294 [Rhodococcus jostii RHA1]